MPSRTPSGKGLYLTVYPLSRPNTDTVNHFQGSRKQDPVDSMGSDKTYLVRLETTQIRFNKLTADGPNCCEYMTKLNTINNLVQFDGYLSHIEFGSKKFMRFSLQKNHSYTLFWILCLPIRQNIFERKKRRFQFMCFCAVFFSLNELRFQKTYWTIYLMSWTIILYFVQSVKTSFKKIIRFFFGFSCHSLFFYQPSCYTVF